MDDAWRIAASRYGEDEMSQAPRSIVGSQAAEEEMGFQDSVREDKNARIQTDPVKEKLQISWGRYKSRVHTAATTSTDVTCRLDRISPAWWGEPCLCLVHHEDLPPMCTLHLGLSSCAKSTRCSWRPRGRGPGRLGRHRGRRTGMYSAGSRGTGWVDPIADRPVASEPVVS